MDTPLALSRLDGRIDYWPRFLALPEQAGLYERLAGSLAWEQEELVIAGRAVRVPRLVAWYGEPEAQYRYSGTDHPPLPWTPELAELRRRLEAATGHVYNSVLANWYRDGQDSMGWHADKEPELGRDPAIASLSLGAKRRFLLEHVRTGQRLELELGEGDLLLMAGACQHHWRHALPKTRKPCGPRINLTFRLIHPGDRP
ncbi:MAG: alpha-ketoglutarate-dependent dioxygenase AlkB [Gammaproteobacteria bacterium]|nr:alpha-ketoglutarate-dependent dioxygenase AlkB [Gammaproteobacteria bacterium]